MSECILGIIILALIFLIYKERKSTLRLLGMLPDENKVPKMCKSATDRVLKNWREV